MTTETRPAKPARKPAKRKTKKPSTREIAAAVRQMGMAIELPRLAKMRVRDAKLILALASEVPE